MKTSKRTNKKPTPSKRGRKKIDRGKCAYQNVVEELTTVLNNSTVTQHNQRLLNDAAAVTIKAASTRSSIHGARKRMKTGKSRRQIARVLEGLDLQTVEDKTNSVLS
jgi:alkyl hydroperoxide reductase subunit AhpF